MRQSLPKSLSMRRLILQMLVPVIAIAATVGVHAQGYPDRPIKLVVPWPAGGITDAAGRLIAQKMSERMGSPVLVENRAGAAGTLGAEAVSRATADGYTLLLASAETHAIAANLRSNLPYDPQKSFVAIAPFAINPFAVVVRPDFPASTTKELVELIKREPGKYTYSSAGLGSTSQIAMETLKGIAGLDVRHVPFQGQAPALNSLLGGHTDLQMLPAGSAVSLMRGGKVKVIAVSTSGRFFDMPNVPTLREEGYASMNFANWFGLVAPAGVPEAITQRLASDMAAVLGSPDTQAALRKLGVEAFRTMPPAAFEEFLLGERTRWGEVIRAARIKAD